jgi:nucleotide-binding universal stress UspA family protein
VSRVVIGVDGSLGARDAVALGAELSAVLDVPAVLVCVHPPSPLSADVSGAAFEDRDSDAAHMIVDAVAWPNIGRSPERRTICAATPALGLRMAAEGLAAELVVVGSSHRHVLGRVVPGRTAMRLVSELSCPVALAPVGSAAQDHRLRHIGLAYDGSPPARRALTFAIGLARRSRASLTVIDVATPATPLELARYGPAAAPFIGPEPAREEARDHLSEALAELPDDLPATTELLDGDAGARLAEASERFDLLVMGSHGHGVLGRFLLGSTADEVAASARCPLVIVPAR